MYINILNDSASISISATKKYLTVNRRADLGNVPFIAGEIAHWNNNAKAFNDVIAEIATRIPDSDYVSSEGCTPLIDASDPHFSREGQLILGERYAEKALSLTGGRPVGQ